MRFRTDTKTRISRLQLTFDTTKRVSSTPQPGLIVRRINTRMPPASRIMDRPKAAAMIILALWSVSVTAAKGGYYPGGTWGLVDVNMSRR